MSANQALHSTIPWVWMGHPFAQPNNHNPVEPDGQRFGNSCSLWPKWVRASVKTQSPSKKEGPEGSGDPAKLYMTKHLWLAATHDKGRVRLEISGMKGVNLKHSTVKMSRCGVFLSPIIKSVLA